MRSLKIICKVLIHKCAAFGGLDECKIDIDWKRGLIEIEGIELAKEGATDGEEKV